MDTNTLPSAGKEKRGSFWVWVWVSTRLFESLLAVYRKPRTFLIDKPRIGCPASCKTTKGIEGLRAVRWVFAWTRTRFRLPVRNKGILGDVWVAAGEPL